MTLRHRAAASPSCAASPQKRSLTYGAHVWTPPVSDELERELQAALARPRASRVLPPRPAAHATGAGWLWGRMQLADGSWLGLASLYTGYLFDGAQLGWPPAHELRVLA